MPLKKRRKEQGDAPMCTRDITFIVLPKKRFLKPEDKFTIFGLPLQIKSTSLVNCVPFLRSINNLPSPPTPSKKKGFVELFEQWISSIISVSGNEAKLFQTPRNHPVLAFPFLFFPQMFCSHVAALDACVL